MWKIWVNINVPLANVSISFTGNEYLFVVDRMQNYVSRTWFTGRKAYLKKDGDGNYVQRGNYPISIDIYTLINYRYNEINAQCTKSQINDIGFNTSSQYRILSIYRYSTIYKINKIFKLQIQ